MQKKKKKKIYYIYCSIINSNIKPMCSPYNVGYTVWAYTCIVYLY